VEALEVSCRAMVDRRAVDVLRLSQRWLAYGCLKRSIYAGRARVAAVVAVVLREVVTWLTPQASARSRKAGYQGGALR